MALAPLHVEVYAKAPHGDDVFDTWVGKTGQVYQLDFDELMWLIRRRCGFEQKRLEYKPR